jgi:hypothetical protein
MGSLMARFGRGILTRQRSDVRPSRISGGMSRIKVVPPLYEVRQKGSLVTETRGEVAACAFGRHAASAAKSAQKAKSGLSPERIACVMKGVL